MIKFFRKIRYELMNQNKTTKYFKYAIGEIILVVIGILIALQINNWNEDRQNRIQEIDILENIKKDLALDSADVDYNVKYHFKILKEEKNLLAYLQEESILLDSINLNNCLGVPLVIALHSSTYANLQSNDIDILSNNELRKNIGRLYDFYANAVKQLEDKNSPVFDTYTKKLPYFLKYTSLSKDGKTLVNSSTYEDYVNITMNKTELLLSKAKQAKQDEGFKIVLNESAFFREVTLEFYRNLQIKMAEVKSHINKELKRLKT